MITRRQTLQLAMATAALPAWARGPGPQINRRPIPSSDELLPVIGMGTSRTFDTGSSEAELAPLRAVLQAFFTGGGTVIDSSPMDGTAETRVGDVLRKLEPRPPLFAATKVWTTGKQAGIDQMQESARRMAVERFDLIAIHNLKDWRTHLSTLHDWKEAGKVRYIGITTSHGRFRQELLQIMRDEPLDFVQFSYNIADRSAEQDLLPLAAERGIATMINRPYQRGELFARTRNQALPALAGELGCESWGQLFLKWIAGHPAVTSVIPATSKVKHMRDNMGANFGPLPDAAQRQQLLQLFLSL
jgi:diketogulonate reductase-like aldo/keto reductase